MSMIHPGASLNFDGADLQRTDEDEIRAEDIKQQQELHELLSAELPDDLLEESCEGSPSVSRDHESYHDHSHSGKSWDHSLAGESPQTGRSSEGQFFNQPPTQPIPYQTQNEYNPYGPNQALEQSFTDAEKWQMQQRRFPFQKQNFQTPVRDNGVGGYGYHGNNPPAISENEVYGFAERREAEGSEDFDAYYDNNRLSSTLPSQGGRTTPGKSVRFDAFSAPTSPYGYGGGVKYRGNSQQHYHSSDSINRQENIKADDSVGSDYVDASDRNTPEAASELGRDLTQLRILYEARGKKIDKLTRQVESMEQDAGREKRILTHQLNMANDEKNGMSGSLEECQRLLSDKDRLINECEAKINSLKVEVDSLKSAKTEHVKKSGISDRTIENLQQEVVMLQRSDALERARHQHDAALAASDERNAQQLLEVSSMLDQVRRVADAKTEESDQLRSRLKVALKESEDLLLEKSDVINKLSRNLEDAQNQCQTLLAGSGGATFLQQQVSNITKEKMDAEEQARSLQRDLTQTLDHLRMYESAFLLGATPAPPTNRDVTMADSYSELMGGAVRRNIDWKTPKLPTQKPPSGGDLVGSLRQELERALKSNKEKRDQISELQKQVKDLNGESNHWRARADELEKKVKLGITAHTRTTSSASGRSDDGELREALERVEVAENRAIRLEESCRDVKQQMCELIEEHDANKQEAVDRCERACMQLHEDAKRAIRDELVAEHEQRSYEASLEHDQQLQQLRLEMSDLSGELSEVKQSYVHVCAEKDRLEEKYRDEIVKEFEQEKQVLLAQHEEEKREIREEWEKVRRSEEQEWEKERERVVEEKLKEEKSTWEKERSIMEKESSEKIVAEKEKEFQIRLDKFEEEIRNELEKEREAEIAKEKKAWDENKEKEIELRMEELYDEMKDREKTAVTTATSIAQLNWITNQQSKSEESERLRVQSALEEARSAWKEEHSAIVRQAVEENSRHLGEQLQALREEHSSSVGRMRREWEERRKEELKRKEEEMRSELEKLELKHVSDLSKFTEDHKASLDQLLREERRRRKEEQGERVDQSNFNEERNLIISNHKRELDNLKQLHENRCKEYKVEIQRLSSAYDVIIQKTPPTSKQIEALEKKHSDEMERLKSRMRDEYRRWKKERSLLKSRTPTCGRNDEEMEQLRHIYVTTLGCIKDEMLSYARSGRAQTIVAIKKESEKERRRIFEKLRSRHHSDVTNVLPSFLVEPRSRSTDRITEPRHQSTTSHISARGRSWERSNLNP